MILFEGKLTLFYIVIKQYCRYFHKNWDKNCERTFTEYQYLLEIAANVNKIFSPLFFLVYWVLLRKSVARGDIVILRFSRSTRSGDNQCRNFCFNTRRGQICRHYRSSNRRNEEGGGN
jgi:hypothetical protein